MLKRKARRSFSCRHQELDVTLMPFKRLEPPFNGKRKSKRQACGYAKPIAHIAERRLGWEGRRHVLSGNERQRAAHAQTTGERAGESGSSNPADVADAAGAEGAIGAAVNNAVDAASEAAENDGGVVNEVANDVGNAANDAANTIGSLFG